MNKQNPDTQANNGGDVHPQNQQGQQVYPQTPQPVNPPNVHYPPTQKMMESIPEQPKNQDQQELEEKHESLLKKKAEQHKSLISMAKLVGGALVISILIIQFVFQPYQVFGESMSSTLHGGDRLIINKAGKTMATITRSDYIPSRGEIIVFKSPLRADENLIKRVVGLPGDKVDVVDGIITITNDENPDGFNPDQEWDENLPRVRTGNISLIVGDGQLFVAGDNRAPSGSLDSRNQLGLIGAESIIGELVLRILPIGDATFY